MCDDPQPWSFFEHNTEFRWTNDPKILEFLHLTNAQSIDEILAVHRKRETSIYGLSELIRQLVDYFIPFCAASKFDVLITGETGTGKECVVNEIRKAAKIDDSKYRAVNCAEFSETLIASELFGHKKGAFTGATADRKGLCEVVQDGAIFLDELGALSQDLQAKILRVIQERTFRPVGSNDTKILGKGVRIYAATNAPENIRQDLKWRFQEHIYLPPLRERFSDIFVIMEGLLEEAKKEKEREIPSDAQWGITFETLVRMLFSRWPGNVRELKNAVQRSIAWWEYRASKKDSTIGFIYWPEARANDFLYDVFDVTSIWMDLLENLRVIRSLREKDSDRWMDAKETHWLVDSLLRNSDPPKGARGRSSSGFCFSCLEALEIILFVYCFRFRETARYNKVDIDTDIPHDVDIHRWINLLNIGKERYFPVPRDIQAKYADTGSPQGPEGPVIPDLTLFSEKNLLLAYYMQLVQQKNWVQVEVARAAEISENAVKRRLENLGLKEKKEPRKRDRISRKRE